MRELGDRAGPAVEALAELRIGSERVGQNLDRDGAVQSQAGGCARPCALAAVHPTAAVAHSTPRRLRHIAGRIAVLQPAAPWRMGFIHENARNRAAPTREAWPLLQQLKDEMLIFQRSLGQRALWAAQLVADAERQAQEPSPLVRSLVWGRTVEEDD